MSSEPFFKISLMTFENTETNNETRKAMEKAGEVLYTSLTLSYVYD